MFSIKHLFVFVAEKGVQRSCVMDHIGLHQYVVFHIVNSRQLELFHYVYDVLFRLKLSEWPRDFTKVDQVLIRLIYSSLSSQKVHCNFRLRFMSSHNLVSKELLSSFE